MLRLAFGAIKMIAIESNSLADELIWGKCKGVLAYSFFTLWSKCYNCGQCLQISVNDFEIFELINGSQPNSERSIKLKMKKHAQSCGHWWRCPCSQNGNTDDKKWFFEISDRNLSGLSATLIVIGVHNFTIFPLRGKWWQNVVTTFCKRGKCWGVGSAT